MKEYLSTAVIRGPFGVKGYLKVRPFSEDFTHFFKLKEVTVHKESMRRVLHIEDVKNYSSELLVKFSEISTPEEGRLLSGFEILIHRNDAGRLEKDEIYTADLIGLKLIYNNAEECGEVVSLVEGAQSLLLEVKCTVEKLRLVPYLKGVFVGGFDLEKGTLELLRRDLVQ